MEDRFVLETRRQREPRLQEVLPCADSPRAVVLFADLPQRQGIDTHVFLAVLGPHCQLLRRLSPCLLSSLASNWRLYLIYGIQQEAHGLTSQYDRFYNIDPIT